jgi:nucleoside 2-deoxyribosyltransferase
MNFILRHIADKSKCPGHAVRITLDEEYRRLYCKNGLELDFFLKSLDEQHVIRLDSQSGHADVTLTTNGWIRIEELERPNIESKQAFVAMWFDDTLDSAYTQGIAGIEEDTGFKALRIDMKQFNEKICDRIIAEIRRSRFLIADVTGHRAGVYFEAGYAMGLGLPVIWTCGKEDINNCHFDTRQYNHITWETPEELRTKLRDRILATIG